MCLGNTNNTFSPLQIICYLLLGSSNPSEWQKAKVDPQIVGPHTMWPFSSRECFEWFRRCLKAIFSFFMWKTIIIIISFSFQNRSIRMAWQSRGAHHRGRAEVLEAKINAKTEWALFVVFVLPFFRCNKTSVYIASVWGRKKDVSTILWSIVASERMGEKCL